MGHVRNHNRSSEDQITLTYLKLLDLEYSKYVTYVSSEVPNYTAVSNEEGEISDTCTLENQLFSFVKSIVVDYEERFYFCINYISLR